MASSIVTRSSRRPVVCAFLYPRSCISSSALVGAFESIRIGNGHTGASDRPRHVACISRRLLSTSTPRRGSNQQSVRMRDNAVKDMLRASGRDKSLSVEMKRNSAKAIELAGAQLDIGLLPETLVMPTSSALSSAAISGRYLPSLLSRARWRLEWARAKLRGKELATLLMYKYRSGGRGAARPKLDSAGLPDLARRLHHDMWSAFAAGDVAAIRKLCAHGLADSLAARIARRGTAEKVDWTLHHYVGRPGLVSNKAAGMMDGMGVSVRQAVVRIRSRQTSATTRVGRKRVEMQQDAQKADPEQGRDCDELVVIQRVMLNKKELDWVIWGTTKESDITPILDGTGP